jgi:hypothetical protein
MTSSISNLQESPILNPGSSPLEANLYMVASVSFRNPANSLAVTIFSMKIFPQHFGEEQSVSLSVFWERNLNWKPRKDKRLALAAVWGIVSTTVAVVSQNDFFKLFPSEGRKRVDSLVGFTGHGP